ncbi:hypothetical protein AX17_001079 [Amanita inopinata Kibby_2008]|nr:hypothetical protein AX17_001079 [Amanita inopinata Kibby_2008]
MSALPVLPGLAPPPLPPGWSEHIAPNGQVYYYNAHSKESTYVRPLPAFPLVTPQQLQAPQATAKKKEKPLFKTRVPGTDWLRVKTTEGNVFYSHTTRKESVWTVPEEIKDALEAFEREEHVQQQQMTQQQVTVLERHSEEIEVERIKNEVQDLVKRKAEEAVPVDEFVISKKVRTGDVQSEQGGDESTSEDDEEEWQKEAAEQLAAEAEAEEKRRKIEEQEQLAEGKRAEESKALGSQINQKVAQQGQEPMQISIPDRVDLSVEEAKALFKTLLREKDVNPLHPWDKSLPLFVSDPRYVLLSSVTARREAFDEYCRERARELRQSDVKKERGVLDPKVDYEKLLKEEVKSTRTTWTDFRRAWKKDRRFYGWGRDDREREKRFRDYMKELGEKKRAAAEKAEVDFVALLKERVTPKEGLVWKEVKRGLYDDSRYDAVGSSSLREELFNTFLKGKIKPSTNSPIESKTDFVEDQARGEVEGQRKREERKERAVRQREEKVRVERSRVGAQIERSKQGIGKEEDEGVFRTLLTDAIRDPQISWDMALPQLKTDPRFVNSRLPLNQQLNMFHNHAGHLRAKHINSLRGLFQSHAPVLDTPFTQLPVTSLLSSLPTKALGYEVSELEQEYRKWQRERFHDCRRAFDEMLSENSFVEFWGRLGKMGGEGVDGGVKADDMGEGEGEGGGGAVDMKVLARNVDINDMEKVLKGDKRYTVFDHIPEQREQWIRSDVARMRTIVINREIFLRELISNANDALEKLRLTSLTDKQAWNGVDPLNITIKAIKDEDGKGGRIIISDTGIGMGPEELKTNLGTLAKSGTSEFLARAESQDGTGTSNLIGAFGLGFYSSFLVADRVEVASIPPKSDKTSDPVQHVFNSGADESTFEVYADPRGNTLGRGTEITLYLKGDALEYLEEQNLQSLVDKHSSYSSSFPIYLFTRKTIEIPDWSEEAETEAETVDPTSSDDDVPETAEVSDKDEEEAVVEDVSNDEEKEEASKKTKTVQVEEWVQLNSQPPLWTRDPKSVTDEEYVAFYKSFFKDYSEPLAWHHFAGDSGSGVSFKAMIFLPSEIDEAFWKNPLLWKADGVKLMVKRVFITSEFGDYSLPKWASWAKVVVDAEDLPLNVSRETLQSSHFLKQLKSIILKRLIQLFSKVKQEDAEKFAKVQEVYGALLKLGTVEDEKNREKLLPLIHFSTNQRNSTSLDDYIENKKQGQKQIFYLAEMGKMSEDLAQSVFIEKLHARGYEVLLLTEPLDELLVGNVRQWKRVPFQDAAKAGLRFGDEDMDPEEEKEQQKSLTEKFQPLIDWLTTQADGLVRKVVISNRLVKSPCAVVADTFGYTANMQKMMNAINSKANQGGALHDYALKAKVLEINPRSPLIEGLLQRIESLPTEPEQKDLEAEEELKEVTSILIDSALVRSGFEVQNANQFFNRMDRVLRRSLGVSETAPTDETVKPAPPVDPELPSEEDILPIRPVMKDLEMLMDEEDDGKPRVVIPEHLKNKVQIDMEEIEEEEEIVTQSPGHDEL